MNKKQQNKINEMYPVANDTFSNVEFRDNLVGNSTPSKDRINPTLLQDVQTAALKAGIKVSITTAISGHEKGTRHEPGNAVDIAMVNNQLWKNKRVAIKKGIYDDIERFVSELEKLGYKKNVGESGNPKVVLTFGFKNHHHHVHVSNTNSSKSQPEVKPTETQTTAQIPNVSDSDDLKKLLDTLKGSGEIGNDFKRDVMKRLLSKTGLGNILDLIPKQTNEGKDTEHQSKLIENEIKRIKTLLR
jgi:hypothetical protein